jgi:hypothetical protein
MGRDESLFWDDLWLKKYFFLKERCPGLTRLFSETGIIVGVIYAYRRG